MSTKGVQSAPAFKAVPCQHNGCCWFPSPRKGYGCRKACCTFNRSSRTQETQVATDQGGQMQSRAQGHCKGMQECHECLSSRRNTDSVGHRPFVQHTTGTGCSCNVACQRCLLTSKDARDTGPWFRTGTDDGFVYHKVHAPKAAAHKCACSDDENQKQNVLSTSQGCRLNSK